MIEPHERLYRHFKDKYKIACLVRSGREYEQSLPDRGDLTLRSTPEAILVWRAPMTGKRGTVPIDADHTTLSRRNATVTIRQQVDRVRVAQSDGGMWSALVRCPSSA